MAGKPGHYENMKIAHFYNETSNEEYIILLDPDDINNAIEETGTTDLMTALEKECGREGFELHTLVAIEDCYPEHGSMSGLPTGRTLIREW